MKMNMAAKEKTAIASENEQSKKTLNPIIDYLEMVQILE
jgi:hypothetical protein